MATSAPPNLWQRKGHSTASSYLVSAGAQTVIDFVAEVLKATVVVNMPTEDKKGVWHACFRIGDTTVMIKDASEEHSAVPAWLYVYMEDVDKTYELALEKGAKSVQAPKEQFYGDRMGAVKDFAGNTWFVATQKFIPKCPEETK